MHIPLDALLPILPTLLLTLHFASAAPTPAPGLLGFVGGGKDEPRPEQYGPFGPQHLQAHRPPPFANGDVYSPSGMNAGVVPVNPPALPVNTPPVAPVAPVIIPPTAPVAPVIVAPTAPVAPVIIAPTAPVINNRRLRARAPNSSAPAVAVADPTSIPSRPSPTPLEKRAALIGKPFGRPVPIAHVDLLHLVKVVKTHHLTGTETVEIMRETEDLDYERGVYAAMMDVYGEENSTTEWGSDEWDGVDEEYDEDEEELLAMERWMAKVARQKEEVVMS